jgi:hypothetical protein
MENLRHACVRVAKYQFLKLTATPRNYDDTACTLAAGEKNTRQISLSNLLELAIINISSMLVSPFRALAKKNP